MKRSILNLATLVAIALAPSLVAASSPNKIAPDLGENDATSLTASMKCQIIHVNEGDKVVLRDLDTGAVQEIAIVPEIRLRARAKRDFDGRRKLAFADLSVGQTVKVTVLRHNGLITRIDVLKKT